MLDASQEASRDEVVAIEEENEEATTTIVVGRGSSMHPINKEGCQNLNKPSSVFQSPYKSESNGGGSELYGKGGSPNLKDIKTGKFFSPSTGP